MKHWYFLFFSCVLIAQNDSINLLDEVKLYGNFSPKLNAGFHIQIIKDSVINKRPQTLSNLLQNNANIYFKQSGNAMVSSVSLRGSGASHTGVYFNGIAINSSLNGQTDFNTLSANSYDQIEIRKGAGSVLFGSGAIGGAINLRDKIIFYKNKEVLINLSIASFNTQMASFKTKWSNSKFYSKIAFSGSKSDNDYPYKQYNLKNENAAYKNYHLKTVLGYKINTKNQLRFYTAFSNNDRELSRTIFTPSNSKYKTKESRSLLSWKNYGNQYNATLKLAFLTEEYNYFPIKTSTNYSFGKTNNAILKYYLNYFYNSKTSFNAGIENRFTKGKGTNIDTKKRNNFESFFLFHQKPNNNLTYNLSVRKGFSDTYKIPFIYAADLKYTIKPNIDLKTNFTTNYKTPTFNDLYWTDSGNPNLLAEKSKTFELSASLYKKNTTLNLTTYFTKSKDLIQWRPVTTSFWRPINIQDVASYGLEFEFKTSKQIGKHHLNFNTQYNYTISKDLELNKQLIYIPFHKANVIFDYKYKDWFLNLNQQYNGKVFTTTSNTQTVRAFWLTNLGLSKSIFKNKTNIGFEINNLLNIDYQTVAYRPMPSRNYTINLTLKF